MLEKVFPKDTSARDRILVVIILLLIGGLLIYYFIQVRIEKETMARLREGPQEIPVKAGMPGDLRLVKFPQDLVNEKEIKGIPATVFSKNDIIGIEGSLDIQESGILTFRILNREKRQISGGEPEIQFWQGDQLRICCISPPEESGEYILELFLNSKKVPTFPIIFRVSP